MNLTASAYRISGCAAEYSAWVFRLQCFSLLSQNAFSPRFPLFFIDDNSAGAAADRQTGAAVCSKYGMALIQSYLIE